MPMPLRMVLTASTATRRVVIVFAAARLSFPCAQLSHCHLTFPRSVRCLPLCLDGCQAVPVHAFTQPAPVRVLPPCFFHHVRSGCTTDASLTTWSAASMWVHAVLLSLALLHSDHCGGSLQAGRHTPSVGGLVARWLTHLHFHPQAPVVTGSVLPKRSIGASPWS